MVVLYSIIPAFNKNRDKGEYFNNPSRAGDGRYWGTVLTLLFMDLTTKYFETT